MPSPCEHEYYKTIPIGTISIVCIARTSGKPDSDSGNVYTTLRLP